MRLELMPFAWTSMFLMSLPTLCARIDLTVLQLLCDCDTMKGVLLLCSSNSNSEPVVTSLQARGEITCIRQVSFSTLCDC